jgi:hypothetical protein
MNTEIIIVLVILFLAANFAVAAFGQEQGNSSDIQMLEKVLQYCRFVHDYGMNNGKEDIQRDLVDTGKISEGKLLLIPKSCDDAKDTKQDMENLKNSLSDAGVLGQMDK